MSLTPQDNSRSTYPQTNPTRHIFQGQPNLSTPSPSQQRAAFPRPTQGGIRPPGQHNATFPPPYTPNNGQAGPPRKNGNSGITAEQQIAQGVLSTATAGSGANTPQRRPPPLGTSIHMPGHGTPQNPSMSVNPAMNSSASINQGRDFGVQQHAQTASPAHQIPSAQRSSLNASPANSNIGSRPRGSFSGDASEDMSMIDPQLAIDQQLTDGDHSMLGAVSPSGPPVVQGEMLSAPPGGNFPTFDALFASAQAHALAHGYAFVIGRSKRDNRGLKKVFLICDRGGTNKEKIPGEQRQRKTKSRKCGCTFGVYGLEGKTTWLLRGRIDGEHLAHNHPPSESPTEHPGARKLDPKAVAAVKTLEENGTFSCQICVGPLLIVKFRRLR